MHVISILQRRRKRRIIQKQQRKARLIRTILTAGVTFTMLFAGIFLGIVAIYSAITYDLPSTKLLPELLNPQNGSLLQPSHIYDRSGENILLTFAPQDEPRSYISLDQALPLHIPPSLIKATTALMDQQFWTHPGYQIESLSNPDSHPTIAQKLVSELLLWNEPPSLRRAIREQILAGQITSRYGRDTILEWYLNSADYGNYAIGAESAARLYFGKPISQITLAEAVLLAAVNQQPAINPFDAPQAVRQRQQEVLQFMLAKGLITTSETKTALMTEIIFQTPPPEPTFAPAFRAMVLSQLNNQFNLSRIEKGGMQVFTTLDFSIQVQTECALQTQLIRLNNSQLKPTQLCAGAEDLPTLPPGENPPQYVSATVLDPRTGQILALVGEYSLENDTGIITPHHPGTLLTPFVYLTGFSRGMSPASLVWDLPPENTQALSLQQGYDGPMRLRNALVEDKLTTASQVYNQMGPVLIQNTIKPFGMDISSTDLPSLLETKNSYTVIQMAQAYGILAAQGAQAGQKIGGNLTASTLLSIRDANGKTNVDWNIPKTGQVVSAQLAYLLTDILKANVTNTGLPAALKSGKTSDSSEIWAAEYTPERVAIVWASGEALNERLAVGLSSAMIKFSSRGTNADDWPMPEGILHMKVCDPSGMLPTNACPNIVDEIFIEGYQPIQNDTMFKFYSINKETGLLATVFTPEHLVEKRVFMSIPSEAQFWAIGANLPIPPTQYDTIQAQTPLSTVKITSPDMLEEITGKVSIKGTAGGDNFSYYRLQYGQGLYPQNWAQIGTNIKQPVNNGSLAEWDTTGLHGLYTIQLMVIQTDNSLKTSTIQVSINNP